MSAAAIIHIIQGLSFEEQNFVIEQIMKLRQKNKQAETTEIGSDFAERKEAAAISDAPKEYFTIDEFEAAVISDIKNYYTAQRDAVEQGYSDYLNGNVKPHSQVRKRYERYL